jgi:hypothetical protein
MFRNNGKLTIPLFTILTLLTTASSLRAADIPTVFYVSNNDTSSRVSYGIRLNSNCSPAGSNPVYYYWLRTSGSTRELGSFEQAGYGIANQSISGNNVDLVFRLFQRYGIEKPLTVTSFRSSNGSCEARAFTTINGVRTQLSHAHVQVNSTRVFGQTIGGTVLSIELVSLDQSTEMIPCRSNCTYGIP